MGSRRACRTAQASPAVHADEAPAFHVNETYARAYEQRKRKEELSALERRRQDATDDDASDSETEDEDGDALTKALDADIQQTLALIRTKDPVIYDPSVAFFEQNPANGEDAKRRAGRRQQQEGNGPLHYKDVVRQQVIAGDVSGSDDEEGATIGVQTYADDQAAIKKAFLLSVERQEENDNVDDSDEERDGLDGGLFTVRKQSEREQNAEDEDYDESKMVQRTLSKNEDVDPSTFLEHYLSSEGWKDKRAVVPHYDDIVKADEEDAEALEKAEEFEHTYNFRFEEQGSSVIQTHARRIDDTVRREDDSRKRKRAERKARKAQERQKKELELRRLKNLKQAEIEEKLKKVARLMGKDEGSVGLKADDLEGDFDPDEHDKRMQAIFDEHYYDEDNVDTEKPTWEEDEDGDLFAGLPFDPEEEEEQDEEDATKTCIETEREDEDEVVEVNDDEQDGENGLQPETMTVEEMRRKKQEFLDELYSLDYEDLIGDIKCRFKYRRVPSNDFGLTADEIMAADDKELRQLVSLKRMAPYADSEYFVDRKLLRNIKKSVQKVREENRRRKPKQETASESEIRSGNVEQPTKKRKRNKKKKVMEEDALSGENRAMLDGAFAMESKHAKSEDHAESMEPKNTDGSAKKKRRNKKKKSNDKNVFASTGLPSSRLESYKLVKAVAK